MKKWTFLLFVFLLLFAACGTKEDSNEKDNNTDENHMKGDGDVSLLTDANNHLAFDLLFATMETVDDNVFLSPSNLYIALSLVYNGADGETKKEMDDILKFTETDALNQANLDFYETLMQEPDGVNLHIANSLWLNDWYSFRDEFRNSMENYYDAEITEVDMASPTTPKIINAWVDEKTNGRIKNIIEPPIDPQTIAFLMNAIYLKADWKYAFDPSLNQQEQFQLSNGATKDVEMMTLMEELEYLENEHFQAVSLPYGDGAMSMQIYLPKESSDFSDVFTYDNWNKWKDGFVKQEGRIYLPAFELEFEVSLERVLQSLGMKTAFDEMKADFSLMVNETDDVFIHAVKQKTFLLVDEEGTEAAGVTSVEVRTTSAIGDGPFEMKIDRPFYLGIKDEETDAILFIGKISDPPARTS